MSDDLEDQKEENRLGTIGQFGTPETDWTAEYAWTRYRGPAAHPVPGGWVLGDVEADGVGWSYFGDAGVGEHSDNVLDDLLENPDIDDGSEAFEDLREAEAWLVNTPVDTSPLDRDPDVEHELVVAGERVFRRIDPDPVDLDETVAEALDAFHRDEDLGDIAPSSGRKPDEVRKRKPVEKRREQNTSLGRFEDGDAQ